MTSIDTTLRDAVAATQAGRHEAALELVATVFGEIASGAPEAVQYYPFTMFLWGQLCAANASAAAALERVRDYHAHLLLNGDSVFSGRGTATEMSRFQLVVEIDHMLNNKRGTYQLFKQLMTVLPAFAGRNAHLAMPAMVEAGDFALADRFLGDPLARLGELNGLTVLYPLFPAENQPPRLAAELSNFLNDVMMRAAILRGTGRGPEADAVVSRAKQGLVAQDMRELAERELAAPGTIMKELAALQERYHSKGALN